MSDELEDCSDLVGLVQEHLNSIDNHIRYIQYAHQSCLDQLGDVARMQVRPEDKTGLESEIMFELRDYDNVFTNANYVLLQLRDTLQSMTHRFSY